MNALSIARDMLNSITPLNVDCGAYCSANCCKTAPDRVLGVHLFPGEAAFYFDASWADIVDSTWYIDGVRVKMLVCPDTCPRENRPLACRIFPLTPLKNGTVGIDCRAYEVCPIAEQGMKALRTDFILAVIAAMETLKTDPEQAYFVKRWIELEGEYRRL